MTTIRAALLAGLSLSVFALAHGADDGTVRHGARPCAAPDRPQASCTLVPKRSQFTADDTNFLLFRHSAGDDNGLRGRLALRYWLSGDDDRLFYLKWHGEFDAYPTTRDEGRFVWRNSNPGIVARFEPRSAYFPLVKWLEFGAEHHSNYGDIDPKNLQTAPIAGHPRDFDDINRSSSYLSAGFRLNLLANAAVTIKGKYYVKEESAVTWGPPANTGASFADYDRYTVRALWAPERGPLIDVEWTTGDGKSKTDSWNIGLGFERLISFPLYLRVHHGPMNTLSQYTEAQTMAGVGVSFSW